MCRFTAFVRLVEQSTIEVKHLENDDYVLAERHLPYGTDLSVVRSATGVVTHIVHAGRAFRKEPR